MTVETTKMETEEVEPSPVVEEAPMETEEKEEAKETTVTFTLEVLQLIKEQHAQHGLRHGDYQRYGIADELLPRIYTLKCRHTYTSLFISTH